MRPSFTLLVLSIAVVATGCRNTSTVPGTLTPVGTLPPQLAPVSQTSATAIGPFGSKTRIPPPGTGSYAVPNNYMGGTTAVGQIGFNDQAATDGFRSSTGVQSAAFADAPTPGAVAPTSFGAGFSNQPAAAAQPPAMQPQLGGMRIHDLTGSPPPPGYHGPAVVAPNQYQQNPSAFTPNPRAFTPNPRTFTPNPPRVQTNQPVNIAPPPNIPRSIPGADVARGNQPVVSVAQNPNAAGFGTEVPFQSSPLQPSFNGASQFQSQAPSTEPVNNGSQGQPQNLPWRRPGG